MLKGEITADLVWIYLKGKDAFGNPFDVALTPEDARRMIFRLHRIVIDQQRQRDEVNSKGRAA